VPQIQQDIFPAIISVAAPGFEGTLTSVPPTQGAAQIHTARIIVTEDRVLIARDSVDGPQLVFSEGIDPASHDKAAKKSNDSYVTTLSGKRIAFSKDDACGCGSRLRSWNPFRMSTMSVKNPTE
jgi:hypothetical protein